MINLQIPEDLRCARRPQHIHWLDWTPSKQGSEGARPVGAARAGPENRRRPQGGRQRDSPRLPSRSTAKTRRRLSMVRSRLGVATAAAPKRSPGVRKSLVAPKQLSPPFPAQLGEAPGTLPAGGGPGQAGAGRGAQVEGADPGSFRPGTPYPGRRVPIRGR